MEQGSPSSTPQPQFDSRLSEHVETDKSAPKTASTIPWRRMRHFRLLAFFTLVTTVLGTTIVLVFPRLSWLLKEDKIVESLSVFFYGLAFFVAILRWSKCWQSKHRSGWLPGVAALGVIGALEELSYGQRVLEYSAPIIAGVEIDALHDFANVAFELLKQGYATNAALMATISAGCVGLLGYGAVRYGSRTISIVKGSQPLLILTFLAFLIATAALIDLEIVKFAFLRIYEEIFEMNAAFAAFLLSLVVNNSVLEK